MEYVLFIPCRRCICETLEREESSLVKKLEAPSPAVQEAPPKAPRRFQTFSSLRYRNFRYLWTSTLFASAGNWIQQVTLGWLVYDMTGSPFLVGTLQGVRAFPFLFAGPLGGVIADRVDRRKLLMINQAYLAILGLGFAFDLALHQVQVWHLFAFTFLGGIGWALNNPVRQALVANSVPRESLMNAIALNSMAFNINRVIGPAAGGLLIAFFGPATNFFIQAVAYTGVFIMVLPINIPRKDFSGTSRHSMASNMVEGFKYVVRDQLIMALILVALIPSLLIMPFTSGLMPVFSEEVLHAGPEGLGLLLSAFGFGGLVGALALATMGSVRRKGMVLLGAAVFAGLAMVAFSQTRWLPLSLAALVGVGAAHMMYMTSNNTILQTITPDEFRGRVMSLYMLDHGFVPLGGLMAGTLAQLYGSPVAILAGGAAMATLILVVGVWFPRLRTLRE